MTFQPARSSRGRSGAILWFLAPCLVWAGQVVVDLDSSARCCSLAVDSTRTERSLVSDKSSTRKSLIAVPPLSRVTSVVLAFDGQTRVAMLPCGAALAPGGEGPPTTYVYRERDSGGLTFIECWDVTPEPPIGVREPGSDRPARLEVGYEPLPRAERAARESLFGDCSITDSWPQRPLSDSAALLFSNPMDAREWYSPPDTNLSSLFGGDSAPYDFEFAELAEMPLGCQVIILAHFGGWGNVRVENAHDILPAIMGIREYLRTRGISSILVPFYRAQGGFLGKLRTITEMFELHHSDENRLPGEIDRFLSRHPRQRIVMVGLSNGAAFADEVMQRLSDSAQGRVCALEFGAPFLNPVDAGEAVLRLDNHGEDPVATGEYWTLMRVRVGGVLGRTFDRLTGRQRAKPGAFVAEHEYSWTAVRQEVVSFLDGWLSR